jgi:hypothetical protein
VDEEPVWFLHCEFAMTRPASEWVVPGVGEVHPAEGVIKVGVEAAGHCHLRMIPGSAWSAGWEVLELNPAHVCVGGSPA